MWVFGARTLATGLPHLTKLKGTAWERNEVSGEGSRSNWLAWGHQVRSWQSWDSDWGSLDFSSRSEAAVLYQILMEGLHCLNVCRGGAKAATWFPGLLPGATRDEMPYLSQRQAPGVGGAGLTMRPTSGLWAWHWEWVTIAFFTHSDIWGAQQRLLQDSFALRPEPSAETGKSQPLSPQAVMAQFENLCCSHFSGSKPH